MGVGDVMSVGCMNPLRLAALDASPFCFAKRGGMRGIPRCARNDMGGV